VLAPGTHLTGSTPLYDLVRDTIHRRPEGGVLEIPERAVVVPGTRPARGEVAERWGISLYAPIIVKYRDGKTDAATLLEEALR
jgi:2,3,4,5-tetrahydropyridine-2-carboxylate N-succinyltransferase